MSDHSSQQAAPDQGAASPRPLADVVRDAITRNVVDGDLSDADLADATAGVLSAIREACTIRTVEQLDALPVGAVVMTVWDPPPHHVMTRFSDGWYGWPSRDNALHPLGSGRNGESALLLWHPDWSES